MVRSSGWTITVHLIYSPGLYAYRFRVALASSYRRSCRPPPPPGLGPGTMCGSPCWYRTNVFGVRARRSTIELRSYIFSLTYWKDYTTFPSRRQGLFSNFLQLFWPA